MAIYFDRPCQMPWKGPGKAALYVNNDRLANHVRRSTFLEPKLIDL